MTRFRWAVSPLDLDAHLLAPETDHPPGALKTGCGLLLPTTVYPQDEPLGLRLCPVCWVLFRAYRLAPLGPNQPPVELPPAPLLVGGRFRRDAAGRRARRWRLSRRGAS